MKTIGIIAEYNPFHNGHAYQIAKAKELTSSDYCIVVMSGDYVQRGTPALMDKYLRAEAALKNGADLVLELPVYYALGSAEYFASGAVALLDKLGVVDTICFGSECGDIEILSEFADQLLDESDTFKKTLRQRLKNGVSYPTARNDALRASAPHLTGHIDILDGSNNILGIEYCKALKRRNSRMTLYTLPRNGSSYHDASLDGSFSSALAVREALTASGRLETVQSQIPSSAYRLMEEHFGKRYPITSNDVTSILHYQLLSEQASGYTIHPDIDQELSDRILKKLPGYTTFDDFCEKLKTKNRTYTRVSRSLMHILLHMTHDELNTFCSDDYVYYARMLGFGKETAPLLKAIKERGQIPLLSKLGDADALLPENGKRMLEKDIFASHVYQSLIQHKFSASSGAGTFISEYKRTMLRV